MTRSFQSPSFFQYLPFHPDDPDPWFTPPPPQAWWWPVFCWVWCSPRTQETVSNQPAVRWKDNMKQFMPILRTKLRFKRVSSILNKYSSHSLSVLYVLLGTGYIVTWLHAIVLDTGHISVLLHLFLELELETVWREHFCPMKLVPNGMCTWKILNLKNVRNTHLTPIDMFL